jgi:ATP-binding cassette subfamily C (CFTR/MRP) protein 1
VSSANNSYTRLKAFLGKFGPKDSRTKTDARGALDVENLPVGAGGSILKELHVAPGSLVILQGPVKSYKSTILRTLAGHHPVPQAATVKIGGSVSYAPQHPWMCQSSIQDNIVSFEQPIDLQRYQAVVHACALTQDLAAMPLGDQTPVAEKGISLSGGQRQRVALARAAYRRADIYLLDNPLSAVDDATQEFIWENLIEGLLADATVIVASSRAVRSCTSIVHLSPKGIEGETVNVSGWTESTVPARSPPSRYSHPIKPAANVGTVSPPQRRTSLVDIIKQDVSAEVQLFEEYSDAKLPVALPALLADMQETEMLDANKSVRKESFLDLVERKQEEQGVVSVRKAVGSRRLSYADSGMTSNESLAEQPSHEVAVPIVVKEKHPFFIWINFTGMGRVTLAFMVFLYWFYPAPRLFIEQWIGFWAAKTYSADDQFNMNILALCFVGVMVTRIILDLGAFHYGAAAERNMRKIFCTTVVNAPMTFFMTENLGPIISVFSRDLSIVGDELAQDFHAGIYYIIFNFAVSVFVCVRFPPFVAVVVVIYSSLLFLQYVYSKKIVLIRQEFQQAQDDVFRDLYDSLEGIEILRSAHAEEWALKQLAESLQKNAIAIVAVEKTNVWLARRADFLAVCLCFATVLFVNYFDAPLAARSLMIAGSMPILVLFNWSMKLLGNVQFLLNSVHRIQQYVDQVHPEDKRGSNVPKEYPSTGELKFKDLCLRYRPSLPLALDNVSFDLDHGAKVGVVGRTGSGKSTLLVALFRLIQPCSGSVIVDGQRVSSLAVDALRKSMAIIPQDPAMFQGTLRENLDPYGEFSDQQVRQALFQVGLCETRDMWSTVQVSGEDWSLGERQLVSGLRRVVVKSAVNCVQIGVPRPRAVEAAQDTFYG